MSSTVSDLAGRVWCTLPPSMEISTSRGCTLSGSSKVLWSRMSSEISMRPAASLVARCSVDSAAQVFSKTTVDIPLNVADLVIGPNFELAVHSQLPLLEAHIARHLARGLDPSVLRVIAGRHPPISKSGHHP